MVHISQSDGDHTVSIEWNLGLQFIKDMARMQLQHSSILSLLYIFVLLSKERLHYLHFRWRKKGFNILLKERQTPLFNMSVQRENIDKFAGPFMLEYIVSVFHQKFVELVRLAWLVLGIQPFSWFWLIDRFPELRNPCENRFEFGWHRVFLQSLLSYLFGRVHKGDGGHKFLHSEVF